MKIHQWAKVIWVKTLEEFDSVGALLPFFIRNQNLLEQMAPELLVSRSQEILGWMKKTGKAVPASLSPLGIWGIRYFLFVPGMLVGGVLLNLLGNQHQVHVILNPFFALWLWNAIIFLSLIIRFFFSRKPKHSQSPGGKSFSGLPDPGWLASKLPAGFALRLRYFRVWEQTTPQIWHRWMENSFHLGAVLLLLGAVAGLYLRGFLLSYSFVWESTFLTSPEAMQDVLDVLFCPASLVSGISVPLLGAQGEPMSGAQWIHLFSISSVFWVFIPRAYLLGLNKRAMKRGLMESQLPLSLPYFISLKKHNHPTFLAYGMKLTDQDQVSVVRGLGYSGDYDWQVVSWGEELGTPDEIEDGWIIFNLAQTPEKEIHGTALKKAGNTLSKALLWHPATGQKPSEQRLDLWVKFLKEYGFLRVAFASNSTMPPKDLSL